MSISIITKFLALGRVSDSYLETYLKVELLTECIIWAAIILYLSVSFVYKKILSYRKKKPTIMKTKIVSYNMELVRPCKPFDPDTLPKLPREIWEKILSHKCEIENQKEDSKLYNQRWQAGWRPKNWSYTAQIGGNWIEEK